MFFFSLTVYYLLITFSPDLHEQIIIVHVCFISDEGMHRGLSFASAISTKGALQFDLAHGKFLLSGEGAFAYEMDTGVRLTL